MKLIELIKSSDMVLDRAGIEAPRVNVERMLEKILGLKRVDMYLNPDREVSDEEENQLKTLIDRRLKHEPLQYILGETEFYGIKLKCDRRALIPRPETEFVVSKGLEVIANRKGLNILDLACGSGNIAVAMAVENPEQNYFGSDLSADAIDLAKENAKLNNVSDKITFYYGNVFSPLKHKNILFDIILANPPYIREGDFELLHEQVRRYEPKRALLSGESGLEFIRQMLEEAPGYLNEEGYLIFEVALGQTVDIRDLVRQGQSFEFLETVVDYGGIERVVVLKRI